MTPFETTVDSPAVWGAHAGIGRGHTLEAIAVRLSNDIGELRVDGGLPPEVHTVVTILPQQRRLDILVDGLAVEADPARTTILQVITSLFALASAYNIVVLDEDSPPLFTLRIVLTEPDGRPFAAMIGAAVGDVKPLPGLAFDTGA